MEIIEGLVPNLSDPITCSFSGVGDVADCDNLQLDLNAVYDWASSNNMFFNSKKFSYVCFSSNVSAYKSNLYIDPDIMFWGLLE